MTNELGQKERGKEIYIFGAIAAIITLAGILLDTMIGSMTGGDLSALPQTAVERFAEFRINPWLGLYHLDLLNVIIQIISVPVYFALFAAHGKNDLFARLSFVVFVIGTTVFISNNSALSMFELGKKYFAVSTDEQRTLIAAAGEAMLGSGAHGSAGVFIGFVLPSVGGLMMSVVMLRGNVFGKINAMLGIVGGVLLLVYLVLVTFTPDVRSMATAFAMPGGLMLMAWMVMFTVKLFKLGRSENSGS